MDISDERKKKLEAGKEKLAAFRKKKAKVKKPVKDEGEHLNSKDVVPVNEDSAYLTNNDHINMTNGDEFFKDSESTAVPISKETYFPNEQKTADFSELAEDAPIVSEPTIEEASSSYCEEVPIPQDTNHNAFDSKCIIDTCVSPDEELSDLEKALLQRDKLIQQLTHSLKSNADQQSEKEDLASQVLNLAQHVTQLQTQLKEADQTLQEQLHFHGISTSAIQSAKNQMLQLQSIVHGKDEELVLASQLLEKNNDTLHRSREENAKLSKQLSEKSEELNSLQSCYDAAVSSHEEKQEREASEKSNQLSELENQWRDREGVMKASLKNQLKEIEGLRQFEEELKERESQLQCNYDELLSRLEQDNRKEEKLKALEHELEDLKRQNGECAKEMHELKNKNEEQAANHESSLSNLRVLSDEYNQLSSIHSKVVDDLESMKSKNSNLEESMKQLTRENEMVKSELQELSQKLMEEQMKPDVHQADLTTKHKTDCDQLNNKINELQVNLTMTEESLAAADSDLKKEKDMLELLKQELSVRESSLTKVSEEISDFSAQNVSLQSELAVKKVQIQQLEHELSEKLNAETQSRDREGDLEQDKRNLEENVAELTKEINNLKNQCQNFTETMAQQQNIMIFANAKVEELNNELYKKDGNVAHENEKCRILETQLVNMEQERNGLNETIESLNKEIITLKEDLKSERVQMDIIGEEVISMRSKLDESEDTMQHTLLDKKQSEVNLKAEVEQYKSDVTKLQGDVERFTSVSDKADLKLKSLAEDLEKANEFLSQSEESLKMKTKDHEELKTEMDKLKEREEHSNQHTNLQIEQLEKEMKALNIQNQTFIDKEHEFSQSQEELQGQLESTVNQWQKLQLIVQEKEIELQNLQDDLDEQKRIYTTLRKNHEEDLGSVNSDVIALREAKETNEAHVEELERMLADVQNAHGVKSAELTEAVAKIESMDLSVQHLTTDLSEKEKQIEVCNCEIDVLRTELSEGLKRIDNLKQDLDRANDKITSLEEDLIGVRTVLSNTESNLESEKRQKEYLLKDFETKDQQCSEKEKDLVTQIEKLQASLEDAGRNSGEIILEATNLKSLVPQLESACSEKIELLFKEQEKVKKLENLVDRERQQCNRLIGAFSSLTQNVEAKEEVLVSTHVLLEEKTAEIAEKDITLSKTVQDLEILQADLKKAEDDVVTLQSRLVVTNEEKESVALDLVMRNSQLDQISQNKEVLYSQVELLNDKLEKLEASESISKVEIDDLKSQVTELEASCGDKEKQVLQEQDKIKQLMSQCDGEMQQRIRLESLLSLISEDSEEKDKDLIEHVSLLEEKLTEIAQIEKDLQEKENTLKDLKERNKNLVVQVENGTAKEKCLEAEVAEMKNQAEELGHDLTKVTELNKENVTQLEQEMKKQEEEIFDLKQDNEIIQKECDDLRADVLEKDNKNLVLTQEVDLMNAALERSYEEKEMLKSNFDACLGEMQLKLSDREGELNRWKSQVAEESRNRHETEDSIKNLFDQQQKQMDHKLTALEGEKSQVERMAEETQTKMDAMTDYYEHQMSELELSTQAAQSEVIKMNEAVSKMNNDHENEIRNLNSLHELQMSELMENSLSLEKSMAELQKNLSEQEEAVKQERNEMEQSFENLMSEMDEKKRRSDIDLSRLKKQLEEMKKDHELEIKNVEKRYETQLFDLEDRCSVTSSELERMRKSMVGVEGDFGDERRYLENKIHDLQNVRRELEIKCSVLEDDISVVKEQSNDREEEVKVILKGAAEKQSEMKSDMLNLSEILKSLKKDNESSTEVMKKDYEKKLADLNAEIRHLKGRLNSCEINVELDTKLRDQEGRYEDLTFRLEELKKQVASLTDENLSLKRRLLGHKSLEKKARLLSGVEDICPPLQEPSNEKVIVPAHMMLVASTPCNNAFENIGQSFSPTAEEVSLIQGFVSEDPKPQSARKIAIMYAQSSGDEEPDFVAEESDRFQPESVMERAVVDAASSSLNFDIHPVGDFVITEGFEPEVSDQFFEEISEEHSSECISKLSVGMSPTHKNSLQFQFSDTDIADRGRASTPFDNTVNPPPFETSMIACQNESNSNYQKPNTDELEKQLALMKEELEEKYVFKMRKQQQDIIIEYEIKWEKMEQELEQRFAHKEQSIRNDWEMKFANALTKMTKEFEKKLQNQKQPHPTTRGSKKKKKSKDTQQNLVSHADDSMPNIKEGSEELGDVVEQLSKENKELAEVRDELLKQIDISQTRGLHNRVHHELQSQMSEREEKQIKISKTKGLLSQVHHELQSKLFEKEKENSLSPQDSLNSSVNEAFVEEFVQSSSSGLCAVAPGSIDSEVGGSHTGMSETCTVAAERLLEELEDISQQTGQDLPLEWELTNTIATESSTPENEAGHQSIWEVFGSRCVRQDCQEVRHRYRKLCQCVVKSCGIWEDLVSEEGGSLASAQEGQNNPNSQSGVAKIVCSNIAKVDSNSDNLDEDDIDDSFADNVALESELLTLAEDMVFYKEAFVKKKTELEKENEFLRMELESASNAIKENEERFNCEREEMVMRIEEIEQQLTSVERTSHDMDVSIETCSQEVMTDQMSCYDTNLSRLELEQSHNVDVKEKEETIARLHAIFEDEKVHMNSFEEKELTLAGLKGEMDQMNNLVKEKDERIAKLLKEKEGVNNMLLEKEDQMTLALKEKEEIIERLKEDKDQITCVMNERESTVSKLQKGNDELNCMSKEKEETFVRLQEGENEMNRLLKEKEETVVRLEEGKNQMSSMIEKKTETLARLEEDKMQRNIMLKEKDDQMNSFLKEKEVELVSLQNENDQINRLLKEKEETVTKSEEDIAEMRKTMEGTLAKVKEMNDQMSSVTKEKEDTIARLEEDITAMNRMLKEKEETVARLEEDKDQMNNMMKGKEDEMNCAMKEKEEIVGRYEENNDKMNSLLKEKEEMVTILEKDKDEKSDMLKEKDDHMNSIIQEKDEKISRLQEEKDQMRIVLSEMEETLAGLEKDMKQMDNVLKGKEETMTKLQEEKDQNKRIMKEREDLINSMQKEKEETVARLQEENDQVIRVSKEMQQTLIRLEEDKDQSVSMLEEKEDRIVKLQKDTDEMNSMFKEKEDLMNDMLKEKAETIAKIEEDNSQMHHLMEEKEEIIIKLKEDKDQMNSMLKGKEDEMNTRLVEKGETISKIQEKMEQMKSDFDDKYCQYKENAESKINELEEKLTDLKMENMYLCLTHDGKEETIGRLLAENGKLKNCQENSAMSLSAEEGKVVDFQKQVISLEDKVGNLQSSLEVKEGEIAHLNKQMDNLKLEIEDVGKLASEREKKLDFLEKELDCLKEEKTCLDLKVESLKEQNTSLEKEIRSVKEKNASAEADCKMKEEKISGLKQKNNKLKHEAKDTLNSSSAKDDKLEMIEKEANCLKDNITELQTTVEKNEEKIVNLEGEVNQHKCQVKEIGKNLSAKVNELETVKKDSLSLNDCVSKLQSILNGKEEQVANLERDVNQQKLEYRNLMESSSKKEKKLEASEKKAIRLKDKFGELLSTIVMKEEEIEQLKSNAKNLKSHVEELTQSSGSSDNKVRDLNSKTLVLEGENLNLQSGIEKNEEMIVKMDTHICQLKTELENQTETLHEKNCKIDLLENQVACMEDSNISIQSVIDKNTNLRRGLELELSQLKSQIEVLKQDNYILVSEEGEKGDMISSLNNKLEELSQHSLSDKNNLKLFEDQVVSLMDENNKLQSALELTEEKQRQSDVELNNLRSQLKDLSVQFQDLQEDSSRLKPFEGQVGELNEEINSLLLGQKEKVEIIEKLEQDIELLKSQLWEQEDKIKELSEPMVEGGETVKEELVETLVASLESTHSSDFNVMDGSSSDCCVNNKVPQTDRVIEDEMVRGKIDTSEQSPVGTLVEGGDSSDVRSMTSSHTGDSIHAEKFDTVLSPVSHANTPSMSGLEESGMSSSTSSFNMDLSFGGSISPSCLHDQALVEELNQLKKDLKETKAIYSRENSLLHEALEKEKKVKDYVLNKNESEENASSGNIEGRNEEGNLEASMEQRISLCLEQNKMLEDENGKLRTKIRKQEAVVLIYKHRLSEKEHDSEMWRKSLTTQLQALQKQRDDLVQLLRNQEMGSSPSISEAMGQAALKEESLRKVQDNLMEKMEELDHLHQMLVQRQVELQHCDMERRHLEQLCLLKDQTEMQLMKQKRLMEEQVDEIEHRLQERESILMEEKTQLMEELKEKDDMLMNISQPQSPRNLSVSSPSRSYSTGDLRFSPMSGAIGGDLSSSAEEADKQHINAIQRLREKLRLEYSLKTSRLAESQASAVASYWMRHQNKTDENN